MFKNEDDFNYFIHKAKSDGATNDKIYAVLVKFYENVQQTKKPEYVQKYLDSIPLSGEYEAHEKYYQGIKLLRSFYFGEIINEKELLVLQDYLQRGLFQVNKQLSELKEIKGNK